MRPTSIFRFMTAALILTITACGNGADDSYQRPRIWPKATEPPPASPIYREVSEHIPGEEEIERESGERPARLAAGIEKAMREGDPLQREVAFVYFLPELLQVAPERLTAMHAGLEPGAARTLLGVEIARQWASRDSGSARRWMSGLSGEERLAAARAVISDLTPWAPELARALAREFDLGVAGTTDR